MPLLHRPNLLFVLFDSLSATDCNFPHGEQGLPTLSRLYESSTLFTRAYTPCPESSPARASLFTGLDPCVHGLWTNGVALPATEITFPQRLANAGYNNALVGRWQLAGTSHWTTEDTHSYDFAHTDWAHGPLHRSRQNSYLNWLQGVAPKEHASLFANPANPDHTTMNDEQVHALLSLPDTLSFNHWVGEQLGNWIKRQSPQNPFLAIASFCVGDLFGTQPNECNDGESLHSQSLQQADTALGQLMDQLRASNQLDDTVVIVTAARGNTAVRNENNTELRSDAANPMSERALRVPLLINTAEQQRRVVSIPVSTMDIAPTVFDFAGVPCGPRTQGQTLRDAFSNPDALRGWSMSRRRDISARRYSSLVQRIVHTYSQTGYAAQR